MPLYQVEVERTLRTVIYIDAVDGSEAREGASELADSLDAGGGDWEMLDNDVCHREIEKPSPDYDVWVGGEMGRWVGCYEYEAGER